METNQTKLEKLSKQKLIEMVQKYQEKLAIRDEFEHILRIDSIRS